MEFNDTTNRNGLVQLYEIETGLGFGAVSDNSAPDYRLNIFTVRANEWIHIANQWLQKANDEQIHDDTNNVGDIPEEYSFSTDTQIYDMDADILAGRKYQARDAVTLDWYDLDYYYLKDRIADLYGQDSGKPSKYFIQGRQLITDIPVDVAKVDKYRITYDRNAHLFVVGDTTAEPGFNQAYHSLIYWGPVMDYASGKYPDIFSKARLKVFGIDENDPNSLKNMMLEYAVTQNRDAQYKVGRKTINFG